MSDILDIETIYREERQRWLREEAPRRTFRDVIADSVPYWIVLVAIVLYGLSAPHTSSVFDTLTPGWGFIAPIGVEFGLLYAAFRRRLAKERKQTLPWTLWALQMLLFLTAMLVNGTGAFASVIAVARLNNLSFAAIADQFGGLPATSQAALIMAGLSAFIIPIGALVAGDGLAALALEKHIGGDRTEEKWQELEFTVIYRAVFVRYLQQGIPEKDARLRAAAEVKGYIGRVSPAAVRLLSAPTEHAGQTGQPANGQVVTVKGSVRTFIDTHPDLADKSVNQVMAALRAAGVSAGRTSVSEVIRERKQHA